MDKKHSKICEEISSLMDGEFDLGSKQSKRFLDDICGCTDSTAKWERYHLLRDLMTEDKSLLAASELTSRVSLEIQQEPHRIGSTRWLKKTQAPSNLWKQMVGMGVAASVAAVIVTGIQSGSLTPEEDFSNQFASQYSPAFQAITPASARIEHFNQPKSLEVPTLEEAKRIERLVLEHTLSSTENGLKGLLPYAKIVSYPRIPTQVTKVDAVATKQIKQKQKNTENGQKP